MKTFITSAMILVAAAALQSCSDSVGKNQTVITRDQIPVAIQTLQKSAAASTVHVSGQFVTEEEPMLSFKTGGIIERIFVKEGDAIRKGQLLATLDLTEINAQVAQAKLALEKAQRDYTRVHNLYRDSVATREQFENAKTGLDVAEQQWKAAQFNRSYSEIRAVRDGFVLRKMANEGQLIESGTSVLQTNGAGNGQWKLRVGVSDREWTSIKTGDKAEVTSDAWNKTIAGHVTRKSEGVDAASGTFSIEITLDAKPEAIASGMFGKASIAVAASVNVWTIPYEALLDGDAKNGYVFVTNDGKTAIKVPVVVGKITRDSIQIVSGLENANAVIVSGSAYLRDQSPITISKK